mmetsp:Transcript_28108/g.65683  ORF Transcript_28108/g.65683 Transcript_28108/m.65683 type:complete len:248 (+) Transcript_28108:129-872(+)
MPTSISPGSASLPDAGVLDAPTPSIVPQIQDLQGGVLAEGPCEAAESVLHDTIGHQCQVLQLLIHLQRGCQIPRRLITQVVAVQDKFNKGVVSGQSIAANGPGARGANATARTVQAEQRAVGCKSKADCPAGARAAEPPRELKEPSTLHLCANPSAQEMLDEPEFNIVKDLPEFRPCDPFSAPLLFEPLPPARGKHIVHHSGNFILNLAHERIPLRYRLVRRQMAGEAHDLQDVDKLPFVKNLHVGM